MVQNFEENSINSIINANKLEIENYIKKYNSVQVKISKIIEVLNDCNNLKNNYKNNINEIIYENPNLNIEINGENLNTIMDRINNEPATNFNENNEQLSVERNEKPQSGIDKSKRDYARILDNMEKLLNENKLIHTLMNKMDNLQQQLEETQNDKIKANEENDKVSEYVHQLEKEKSSLSLENKKQKNLIKKLRQSQKNENKLSKSLEEKKNENQILKEINEDLRDFVTELIKDLENVQEKLNKSTDNEIIQNLTKENEELHSSLTQLKSDLNSIQQDLQKAMDSERKTNEERNKMNENIKENKEKITVLLREKEHLQIALKQTEEKLSKEVEKSSIDKETNTEILNNTLKKNKILEKEKNDLLSSLTSLRNDFKNVTEKATKTLMAKKMIQQEIDRVNHINHQLNEDNIKFNNHFKNLEKRIDTLKKEKENLQLNLEQMKEQLKEKENISYEKKLEERDEKIEFLENNQREKEILISELQNENEKNHMELVSLVNINKEMEKEIASLKKEFKEIKEENIDDDVNENLLFIKNNIDEAKHDLQQYMKHLESEYPESRNQSSIYEKIYTLFMYSLNDLSQMNEMNDSNMLNHHFKNFIDKMAIVFDGIKQKCNLINIDSCFYENKNGDFYYNDNDNDPIVKSSCGCKYHSSCIKTYLAVNDYDIDDYETDSPIEFKCPCCYEYSTIILP